MPNSSRECAICHVRWVEAFDRNKPQDTGMPAAAERQAGSGDMCLSCHDGSVVDSRFKVWSTRHHATGIVPSPAMSIPTDRFPLDAQGRMTCATCHTAHAVAGSSDLHTVIFLRQPNVDSSLCLACHPRHAQKNDCQHPLGPGPSPIPKVILEAGGKTSRDGHSILCQTCHEPHGAKNAWMLVLPPSELCIACHTEKAPEVSPPAGAPVHRIGHTYAGFRPPATLLQERASFGPEGELSCLSCHRLHDASGAKPLLIRRNQDSSLCLECHEKEKAVLGSPHDLRESSPDTVNAHDEKPSVSGPCGACHRVHGWAREVPATNRPHSSGCMECHGPGGPGSRHRPYVEAHPVGVTVPEDNGKWEVSSFPSSNFTLQTSNSPSSIALPLDQATKEIGCLTCHDPHVGRPREASAPRSTAMAAPQSPPAPTPAPGLFLRREGSQLCVLCHEKMADAGHGAHDPAQFSPALRQTLGVSPATGSCRVCHTAHNAQGPHLWARAPANTTNNPISNLCGACHNEADVKEPRGTHHPLTTAGSHRPDVAPTDAVRLAQRAPEVSCTSCHDVHQAGPSTTLLRSPTESPCITCHPDKQQIEGSVHDPGAKAWGQSLHFVPQGLCLDCHPIHGPKKQSGLWEALGGKQTPESLCEACHSLGEPGAVVATPHVGRVISNRPTNLPGDLRMARDEKIRCTTCHDVHQNKPNSKLLRAARSDASLCLTCHVQFDGVLGTPHDLRKSGPAVCNVKGELAAESGPCGVCHVVHPGPIAAGTWAQPGSPGDSFGKGLCTSCHSRGNCAWTRVPAYTDHPDVALLNRLSTGHPDYMPTFDDRGGVSPTGSISCPTCHQMHAIRAAPAAKAETPLPHGRLLRTTHPTLCADCHGVETLWRFLHYHQAGRNPHGQSSIDAPPADVRNETDPAGL